MSNQGPEQTAIVALVPSEDATHMVELMASANIPGATIDTYVLPTSRQEAEHLATRLAGRVVNRAAAGYEVTPHASKPISIINNIATGEVVEAITNENFRAFSKESHGDTRLGSQLATKLFHPNYIRQADLDLYRSYFEQYIIDYRPKFTDLRAMRANKAPEVLARYGQYELDLRLSKRGHALLAHMCELIETDTA
jgi:hypothetical protein